MSENNGTVVGSIHNLHSRTYNCFTETQAKELVPLLNKISAATKSELATLNTRLNNCKANTNKAQEIQEQINDSLQQWSDKIRRLGATPISLCKVRLPHEEGSYLWEYPNKSLYVI